MLEQIMSTYGPLGAILLALLYILLKAEIDVDFHYRGRKK